MKKGLIIIVIVLIVLLIGAFLAYPYVKLYFDYKRLSDAALALSDTEEFAYKVELNYKSHNDDASINNYELVSYGTKSNDIIEGSFDLTNANWILSTDTTLVYQLTDNSIYIMSPSLFPDSSVEFESRFDNEGIRKLVDIKSATDILVSWQRKSTRVLYDKTNKNPTDTRVATIQVPYYLVHAYLKEINDRMPTDSFIFSLIASDEFPYDKLDKNVEYPLIVRAVIDDEGSLKLCSMDLFISDGDEINCDIYYFSENEVDDENKLAEKNVRYDELGNLIKKQVDKIIQSLLDKIWNENDDVGSKPTI